MADLETFQHGAVQFPVTAATTNRLLKDVDPAIFYALEYFEAVLERYIAPRLRSEGAKVGIAPPRAVAHKLHIEPLPQLLTPDLKFPLLAVYRKSDDYTEKTISYGQDESTWEFAYILPPLNPAQLKALHPLLRSVAVVLRQTTLQGRDPSYENSVAVWNRAGVMKIRVTGVRYGGYERISEVPTYFRAIVGRIVASERTLPGEGSWLPFDGARIHVDHAQPDAPTVLDVSTFDTAPVINTIVPSLGTSAGGTTVTIKGANFVDGATLLFGTTEVPTTMVDEITVQAVTPAHAAGVVDVSMLLPDGRRGRKVSAFQFT